MEETIQGMQDSGVQACAKVSDSSCHSVTLVLTCAALAWQ
jgi:hypothetical protein